MSASPDPPLSQAPGRARLGRYIELVLLGAGGMGEVYRAYDPQLERMVAIKLMRDRSATFLQRFRREARAMARLSHPRVAQIYDFGEDEESGSPYIVMELVSGEAVASLLERVGQVPPAQVARILSQAAEGLSAAHAAGIVHRDIKPSNLMLDERGDLKLVDFGIARMEEGVDALTRPQSLVGTPHYMAPELVSGHAADERSDIYALGLTAYHMLTGKLPFDAPSAVAVAMKQISEQLPPLAREVPVGLVRLIEAMVEKDRARRLASCAELSRRLAELRVTLEPSGLTPPRPVSRKRGVLVLVGGILVLGSAAGVVMGVKTGVLLGGRSRGGGTGGGDGGARSGVGAGTAGSNGTAGSGSSGTSGAGTNGTAGSGTGTPATADIWRRSGPLRVALLPFKNLGGDVDLALLTEGISETALGELGGLRDRLRLVERNQLNQEVGEIDFGQTRYVDPATKAALGKLQGAELAVQGAYQRAGGQLRVTARLVRIDTGEILDTLTLTKPASGLLALQDATARALKTHLLALEERTR